MRLDVHKVLHMHLNLLIAQSEGHIFPFRTGLWLTWLLKLTIACFWLLVFMLQLAELSRHKCMLPVCSILIQIFSYIFYLRSFVLYNTLKQSASHFSMIRHNYSRFVTRIRLHAYVVGS